MVDVCSRTTWEYQPRAITSCTSQELKIQCDQNMISEAKRRATDTSIVGWDTWGKEEGVSHALFTPTHQLLPPPPQEQLVR